MQGGGGQAAQRACPPGIRLVAWGVTSTTASPAWQPPTASAKAVLLDVDGVLLDSLGPHLRMCADLATRYRLQDVRVPDAVAFRARVAGGLAVSPMRAFFHAVGFPAPMLDRAVDDYNAHFMQAYRPQPFAGIADMLARLAATGRMLGLVTANTRGNVVPALGAAMRFFDERALFFFDSFDPPWPKQACLAEAARRLGLQPGEGVFVGDQPADAEAARAAGWGFLGVSYGWGLLPDDRRWPMAHTVGQIADALAATPARHAPPA